MSLDVEEPRAESQSTRAVWPWLLVGAVAVLTTGFLIGGPFRPHVFNGTVIQSDDIAPPMTGLVYDDGEPVNLEALHGNVVLVYFGYTHCPDLCPAMLSTVNRTLGELGELGERITTMMVTVDPGRDGQEYVGEYVRFFNPGFRGVWGTEEQVRLVSTKYGVHFQYDEPDEDGNYLVAHTASLMAIDPVGVLRVLYPVGVTVEELTADLRALLR